MSNTFTERSREKQTKKKYRKRKAEFIKQTKKNNNNAENAPNTQESDRGIHYFAETLHQPLQLITFFFFFTVEQRCLNNNITSGWLYCLTIKNSKQAHTHKGTYIYIYIHKYRCNYTHKTSFKSNGKWCISISSNSFRF